MKTLVLCLPPMWGLALFAPMRIYAQTFTYTFDTDAQGWSADFADYPPGEEVFYELDFAHDVLPPSITPTDHGLRIQGNNHSDDLIMFVKKHLTGLMPNTTYQVTFDLEVASCAPTNHLGAGGAPGEGVGFLVGATIVEPMKVVVGDHYRMNIDFGGQGSPGEDTDTLGNVGVSDTTTVFTMIHRDNLSHPFTVTTDPNGEVWVLVATDSGFEATTMLYYSTISIAFSTSTGAPERSDAGLEWHIDGNALQVRAYTSIQRLRLLDPLGRTLFALAIRGKEVRVPLPSVTTMLILSVQLDNGAHFESKLALTR